LKNSQLVDLSSFVAPQNALGIGGLEAPALAEEFNFVTFDEFVVGAGLEVLGPGGSDAS